MASRGQVTPPMPGYCYRAVDFSQIVLNEVYIVLFCPRLQRVRSVLVTNDDNETKAICDRHSGPMRDHRRDDSIDCGDGEMTDAEKEERIRVLEAQLAQSEKYRENLKANYQEHIRLAYPELLARINRARRLLEARDEGHRYLCMECDQLTDELLAALGDEK
jgi:hypothetical protein